MYACMYVCILLTHTHTHTHNHTKNQFWVSTFRVKILVEFHRFFLIACIHMYTCLLAARWMMRIQMVSHMLSKQTDLGFWWILLQPRNLRIVISSNSLVHGKMNLGENFNQDLCIELPRVWQQRFQREGISLSFSLARSLARTTYNWHLCLRVLTEKYIFLHTQWHTRIQFDDRACVCTHTLSFCFFLSLSLSLTHTHTHTHTRMQICHKAVA